MGWINANSGEKGMPLCRRPLALLASFALLALAATACDSVPSAPALPDVELPAISREASPTPVPTPVPSIATPGATATTPRDPVTTGATTAPTASGPLLVPRLEIAEMPPNLPEYSRSDWKHWNDTDRDCQDTRAEVLIEESSVPATFKNERRCLVISGLWEGPYTGSTFTEASEVDIDHLVPLKNAHLSGGWQWDAERKEDYANSMATDFHLIAVEKYANRAKGARGPEEWQPSDSSYHCQYAYYWIAVKAEWGLTATAAEWASLEEMLSLCPQPVEIVDHASPATITAEVARLRQELGRSGNSGGGAAVLLATATPEPFSGSLVITEVMPDPSAVRDSMGEWFEIHNPDPEQSVNLQGWVIRKDSGNAHRISEAVQIQAGGYQVLARNADRSANGGIAAGYQYQGLNLTNDGDVIELVEPTGRVVDRFEYGEDLVFPGASTSLDPDSADSAGNDVSTNWCRATTILPNGDFGTPGRENDTCR